MWPSRSLAALVVLATATPSRAGLFDSSDPNDVVTNGVNQGIGFLRGIGILASDKTDTDFIMGTYNMALSDMKKTKWSCVRGLFHEVGPAESMKMWEGRLVDGNNRPLSTSRDIRVEVSNLKDTSDKNFITANVGFRFPEMILESKFTYSSTMLGIAYSRTGTAKFKVGPATVKFPIKMPASKKMITDNSDKKKCQFSISQNGIKSEAGENFEVADIDYPSSTGLSYSKTAMTTVFTKLKQDIRINVFASLERHVANSIKKIVFSCLDAAAADKWKPLNPDVDCMDTRHATRYDQP